MSTSLIILIPVILLGIVGTLCFVGCVLHTEGLPGTPFTAYTNTTINAVCNGNSVLFRITCPAGDSQTRAGWTVGFGTEFALTQNWTVRGETNYYDLGKTQYNLLAPVLVADVRETGFISTVGLNYRFSPGVVVAKY